MLSFNIVYAYGKLFRSGERLAQYMWKAGRHLFRYSCKVAITTDRLYENWNAWIIFRKIPHYYALFLASAAL